ncbi:serine/threonine-protein kinase-like protein tel1 [Amylocarpus encephaloides]|uniref:Serine/threonine-protein kinase Tel1 n=1 Tax=Amylocarpus encephaloides TaxID=45428 RepID=A0A9P7YJ39_9HELO|nr:serine/threonine-protein kinase-like protein tel1 [Amylocarpus encephaloides]
MADEKKERDNLLEAITLQILLNRRNTAKIGSIGDKLWHYMYEVIFEAAVYHKHELFASKAKTPKAAKHMQKCGETVLWLINVGPRGLSKKNIEAIVHHITQILPNARGGFCEVILDDYLKILHKLLGRHANVERMMKETWHDAVDFCVECINQQLDSMEPSAGFSRGSSGTTMGIPVRNKPAVPTRDRAPDNRTAYLLDRHTETLIQSISMLVSPANVPVSDRYKEITKCVLRFWQSRGSSRPDTLHQLVFAVMNRVITYTRENKTSFTQVTANTVIPLIARFWEAKRVHKDELLGSIRDEMLIFLFLAHSYLERSIKDGEDILTMLEDLADVLTSDYADRSGKKDHLQLEDLEMLDLGTHFTVTPLHVQSFQLRAHNIRGERLWSQLQVIGILERLICIGRQRSSLLQDDLETELDKHPRKRQRIMQSSDRIVQSLKTENEKLRRGALQELPFILTKHQLEINELKQVLDELQNCATDKRGDLASWALLAITRRVTHVASKLGSNSWVSLWHIGSRAVTFANTCRAAAIQLHSILARRLLSYQDVGEDIGAMVTSADVSGPVVLCDSAIFLMMHLLHTRIAEVPSAGLKTSQHTVRWLFARWTPADRPFAARHAIHAQPSQIINLLRASLGLRRIPPSNVTTVPLGDLAQTWTSCISSQDVVRYMLLLEGPGTSFSSPCASCPKLADLDDIVYVLDTTHFNSTRRLILELLISKCSELLQSWKSYNIDHATPVSTDTFRSAIYTCLTMLLAMPHFSQSGLQQIHELEACTKELYQELLAFLGDADSRDPVGTRALIDTLTQSMQPYLPSCKSRVFSKLSVQNPRLHGFFVAVANDVSKRRSLHSQASGNENDPMDLDDDFDEFSQRSLIRTDVLKSDLPRRLLSLDSLPASFDCVVQGRLLLASTIKVRDEISQIVPEQFMNYLVSLSDDELLLSHTLLRELVKSDLTFDVEDAIRLLDRVSDILHTSPDLDHCETLLVLVIESLIGLGKLWTAAAPETELCEVAWELYVWLVGKALEKMIISPEGQKKIADLLLLLVETDDEYGTSNSKSPLPSPRSSLFTLLQKGEASVKFYVANKLPDIFSLYLLDHHDAVFVDVLEVLPSHPDWLEGMCFRLFALSKLAARWPTLLRRCVYHIFEIPGRFTNCLDHAIECLSEVSSALKLSSAKVLFDLFAPQILYTWLQSSEGIGSIPFQIFGFPSLRDLVSHAQDEVIGLLMMLGQEGDIQEVVGILGGEESAILKKSFAKTMAYTLAHDLSIPPPSSETRRVTSVSRLKKRLGSENFFHCLNLHFADIIALLFVIADPHESLDKHLAKKDEIMYAAKIMAEIKSLTVSQISVPPVQQPSFRARFLMAQIDHVCNRTEFESNQIYTPALVVFIARKLSDTMHPSLGSMHACSVLRQLRTLICLAGKSATRGYPLEMLLQIFRPFLRDPQCADDAIGITQYLLSKGSEHLQKATAFVAGISLSILASLSTFIKRGRGSNTQESQYQTTVSSVQSFQKWFGVYLRDYYKSAFQGHRNPNYEALLHSAYNTDWTGNANVGSSESDLLLLLLGDGQGSSKMLSQPSRELALEMLCSDFEPPNSFRTDILGDDRSASLHAVNVWKSCKSNKISKKYISWSARVLGRAFVASGHIDQDLLRESALVQVKRLSQSSNEHSTSQLCVLNLLLELTLGHDTDHIGLAESALRLAMTTEDESVVTVARDCLSPGLFEASVWNPYQAPPSEILRVEEGASAKDNPYDQQGIFQPDWVRELSTALCKYVADDALLCALVPVLREVPGFAERAFPFILHLVLSTPYQQRHDPRKKLSASFKGWFENTEGTNKDSLKVLINAILYLRTQPLREEKSSADRLHWLNLNYMDAATAAGHCGMHKTALLFVEEHLSAPAKPSRRSSVKDSFDQAEVPVDLLLHIFQNIDDPDMYYGVQQKSSLESIIARFEYEKDGSKSLAFRGAQFDSHIRRGNKEADRDALSLVKALDVLSLSGVSHSLLQSQQSVDMSDASIESMFRTARKLEQWDIPVPGESSNNALAVYKAFQAINTASDQRTITNAIDEGFIYTMRGIVSEDLGANDLHSSLQTLASLVEMDEVFTIQGSQQIEEMLLRFESRSTWMRTGNFEDVSQILSCRGTTLSTLSQQSRLQNLMDVKAVDTRLVEVQTSLLASKLNRAHNALQESLSLATSMMDLIQPCLEVSLNLEAAIHVEAANALWDQGETTSSIGLLQALDNPTLLKKQAVVVSRSELLSKIGHQVSVARLEKADQIIDRYLQPALRELNKRVTGSDAGQVFRQFAVFCDQQLQDPDSLEDLERLKKLSSGKEEEVQQWEALLKNATSSNERGRYKNQLSKAKIWRGLDREELRRHTSSRDEFLRQSLENYLLALVASDDHDSVALRFSALWLSHADIDLANDAVAKFSEQVPSRKFAPLMNQLTSRLQDSTMQFHQLLFSLVLRICTDHPYHGMYQIYSGASTRPNSKDEAAISRKAAARKVSSQLSVSNKVGQTWFSLNAINRAYCTLAGERDDSRYKSGRRINIKESQAASKLHGLLSRNRVPSPTMNLPLAANLDYSKIPTMVKLEPTMSIASGVSAPKIITAVKGGNDDLRQDAIMEQVFEQVSELLKSNRSTRQRDLKIRTYKVLPITSTAGVIEFVPNTIPLHEYLMPAHERYYPKDLKGNMCRKEIGDVQGQPINVRVEKFRTVTNRFHPVMRHFFTEKFTDPDEWFVKRNAYTRSTAAISILGHVLGLGDRHGHNILLDAESGEVVHIDLGVAFEMGRVLPVPELVPFRLTRDIVDGMGITKTEGVFRRCCEFTLEALRKESYSIMTILDVLRYDPLYSWSISPVRLAKLQEGQSAALNANVGEDGERVREAVNEPGEADRALTVVNKKLSKTLSVQATVSDLINQAGDERNLAVLYSGWAAYA